MNKRLIRTNAEHPSSSPKVIPISRCSHGSPGGSHVRLKCRRPRFNSRPSGNTYLQSGTPVATRPDSRCYGVSTGHNRHNRLNAHMYYKFKVGESEMRPCNADIMTAEHLLQHCRLHDALRRDMYPEPTLLRDKLDGNLEELRRTAAFVRTTGRQTSARRRRRRRDGSVCLFVGCLTSQLQDSASQGRICSDNFTCCHTEIEVADQTFYLTQSQYTDTGPTNPNAYPITPGAWQSSHWSANF